MSQADCKFAWAAGKCIMVAPESQGFIMEIPQAEKLRDELTAAIEEAKRDPFEEWWKTLGRHECAGTCMERAWTGDRWTYKDEARTVWDAATKARKEKE